MFNPAEDHRSIIYSDHQVRSLLSLMTSSSSCDGSGRRRICAILKAIPKTVFNKGLRYGAKRKHSSYMRTLLPKYNASPLESPSDPQRLPIRMVALILSRVMSSIDILTWSLADRKKSLVRSLVPWTLENLSGANYISYSELESSPSRAVDLPSCQGQNTMEGSFRYRPIAYPGFQMRRMEKRVRLIMYELQVQVHELVANVLFHLHYLHLGIWGCRINRQ